MSAWAPSTPTLSRLRDEASTSATVLGTASKGDTVVVLEDAGNGWYKVDYKSVEGYMSGEYLNVSAKADVTIGYGLVQSGRFHPECAQRPRHQLR